MKKIFQLSLLMVSTLALTTSCYFEEDNIFSQSAAERLNAASDKYTGILQGSEGGWVIEYYPTTELAEVTGTGYLWLTKFNKDMSVNVGMNNIFTNGYEEYTSLWEVITDNGPVLTFNSENPNIHVFSDPDLRTIPGSSDNVWGTGVGGDYEFVIVQAPTEDSPFVMLKGKKRGTYNRMTPLPAGTSFDEYLSDITAFRNFVFAESAPSENVLTIDGVRYFTNSESTGMMGRYQEGHDALTETSYHPFLITKRDDKYYLRFRNALEQGDVQEQEFVWQPENDHFVGVSDAANVIEGYDPSLFFNETLTASSGSTSWRFDKTSNKAKAVQDAYDTAYNQFATISYTMEGAAFTNIQGNSYLRINCSYYKKQGNRTIKQSTSYLYGFDATLQDGKVVVTYTGCDDASQAVLDKFAGVEQFVKMLMQTYSVEATNTRFNLNKLTLTSATDSDFWLDVTM